MPVTMNQIALVFSLFGGMLMLLASIFQPWRSRAMVPAVGGVAGVADATDVTDAAGEPQYSALQAHRVHAVKPGMVSDLDLTAGGNLRLTAPHQLRVSDEQRQYQRALMDAYRFTWAPATCTRLPDAELFARWEGLGLGVPGWVFIPINWKCVLEKRTRSCGDSDALRHVLEMIPHRNRTYRHFTWMHQSNIEQVLWNAKFKHWKINVAGIFGEPDLVVFGTRLMNLFWATRGVSPTHLWLPRHPENWVSTPLVRPTKTKATQHGPEAPGTAPASKPLRHLAVWWRGSCLKVMARLLLRDQLKQDRRYNFSGVRSCNDFTRSAEEYQAELAKYTWALAVRGTFPGTFSIAQAINTNTLPVVVQDFNYSCGQKPLDVLQNGFLYGKNVRKKNRPAPLQMGPFTKAHKPTHQAQILKGTVTRTVSHSCGGCWPYNFYMEVFTAAPKRARVSLSLSSLQGIPWLGSPHIFYCVHAFSNDCPWDYLF